MITVLTLAASFILGFYFCVWIEKVKLLTDDEIWNEAVDQLFNEADTLPADQQDILIKKSASLLSRSKKWK